MLTVEVDAGSVERRLAVGDLSCPVCGDRLSPWGWARQRVLRGPGAVTVRVRPLRAWCRRCGATHVLIGIELDRIVDQITARPPGPDDVEALRLPPGVSVFVLRKISIDTADTVVEVSDVVLPGDRTEFVYTTKLTRWPK